MAKAKAKATHAEKMSMEEYNNLKEEYRNKLETRIVLVGKTGVGKSKTGNTILGEKVFEAKLSGTSVTESCKSHVVKQDGKFIKVVDVPGFIDTRMTKEKERLAITQCVIEACPGIHAILFVIRIGRFTEEDELTLARFIEYFGKEAMQFVMVVFTGLDELEEEGQTIEQFIANAPDGLVKFLKSINNRFIAVNNKSNNNSDFVDNLLQAIRGMVDKNQGRFFTNKGLQKTNDLVKKEEEKIFRKTDVKIEEEEAMDFISQHINTTKRLVFGRIKRSLVPALAGIVVGAVVGGPLGALVGGAVGVFVGETIGAIFQQIFYSDTSIEFGTVIDHND